MGSNANQLLNAVLERLHMPSVINSMSFKSALMDEQSYLV